MVIIQRWGRGQHQESIRSCHLSVANIQNRLKANSFQNFHRAFFRKQCFKEDEIKVNQICIWKSLFPTQATIGAFREGLPVQKVPKYRHCLNGGGSDPCLDFCEGFVHMHYGPSKVIIHHPKVIISPQKCPFFPQKPHLFNIFTLKNDLRTFVENCRESHLRTCKLNRSGCLDLMGGST